MKDVKEDIDFNDVVFDAIVWYDYWVKIEKNDNNEVISETEVIDEDHPNALWADISLLATGATEQVKVDDNEVHGLFEKSVKTMVNTVGASSNVYGSYEKDPITPIPFTIEMNINDYLPEDYTGSIEDYLKENITLDNVPIKVFWHTEGQGQAAAYLAAGNVTTDESGNVIGMTAPHKIKVPLGTPWPAERRNIQEGFPLFPQYVQNETNPWDNKESFYLYEYNWNLLAHRDMARHTFYYSDQTEIIEGGDIWIGTEHLGNAKVLDVTLPGGSVKENQVLTFHFIHTHDQYNNGKFRALSADGWSITYIPYTQGLVTENSLSVTLSSSQATKLNADKQIQVDGEGMDLVKISIQ